MSGFTESILRLMLAVIFVRWAIPHIRARDDWMAAGLLTTAACMVVLAMTTDLR